jgi:hypothetical protein
MEGSLVAYKVFTNGSTLQASELNENLMQQSTAVFSNAAARTAAITSPVEGQLTYLEDTNQYASYNGSAWVSPFGLTLIKKQTIGTAVSTVTVADVFSADYDAYKIIVTGGANSDANRLLNVKLGTASNGHHTGLVFVTTATSAVTGVGNSNTGNFSYCGSADTNGLNANFDLISPFLSKATIMNSNFSDGSVVVGSVTGRQTSTTSFTGFDLLVNAGTMTGGTIYVYGYRKAD